MKKHVENVHIFEGDESTIENLGIIQKPKMMPRIKQKIKLSDLEYDSDADEDFEDQLKANPVAFKTPSPPRDTTSLARKCKEPKIIDEELLLQEESVHVTPPPVTPPEPMMQKNF